MAISGIISAIIVGLIIGALGRLVVPGRQHMPIWVTMLIGIVAAFIGSAIARGIGYANTPGIDWLEILTQVGLAAVADLYPDETKRQIWDTLELGYQGAPAGGLHLEAEVYWNRVENPYGDSYVMTPNAFLDPGSLQEYLVSNGMTAQDAALAAGIASQVPLGTVAPEQSGTADILVDQYQGGSYDFFGADAVLEYRFDAAWSTRVTYSWVNENYFEVEGVGTFHSKVPRNKGSLEVRFADPGGRFDVTLAGRGVETYRVGNAENERIEGYLVADFGVGYQLSWWPSVRLSVNAFNVFDNLHREMVASPEIGRLVVGRLNWRF